jgi:phage-related minor tail protein
MGRLKVELGGIGQSFALEVLPAFTRFFDYLAEGKKHIREFFDESANLESFSEQFALFGKKFDEQRKFFQRQKALALLDNVQGRLDPRDLGPQVLPPLEFEGPDETKNKEGLDTAKRFMEALKKERDTLGLTGVGLRLYEARLAGVKGAQLENVRVMAQQIEGFKATRESANYVAETVGAVAGDLQQRFGPALREVDQVMRELNGPLAESERKLALIREEVLAGRQPIELFGKALEKYRPIADDIGEVSPGIARINELLAATPTAQLEQARKDMELLMQAMASGFDEKKVAEAMKGLAEDSLKVTDEASEAFSELKSTIEGFGRDASRTFVEFAFTGKASFKDLIQTMMRELAELAVYRSIFEPLFGAFSNAISGGLGNIFGGGGPQRLGMGFTSPAERALGGPVFASTPYLVGERGPEIFVPRTSGDIVPNNRITAAAASRLSISQTT